jgi:hypothetical protein
MPKPAANSTATPSGSAARSSSSGASTRVALTSELPAPWNRGVRANSPTTAIVSPAPGASGSSAPSFLSRTAHSAATARASAWCAPASKPRASGGRAARSSSASMRATAASSRRSSSSPARTAATIRVSLRPRFGGISRSSPAASAATRSSTAPQSDITSPSKPHSSRSTSVSSHGFSDAQTPLTLLYEHINVHGPASATTRSKPGR